jgi:RHS repeat-associated protein
MPGRKFDAGSVYRYGFNGQEKSDDVTTGNYTAMFWEYDSRIGRRWNVDPKPTIGISDYATFFNNPIKFMDALGDSAGPKKINLTFLKSQKKSYQNATWVGLNNTKASVFVNNSFASAWNQGITAVEDLPNNFQTIKNVFSAEGRATNSSNAFVGLINLVNWWNTEPWKKVDTYEDIAGMFILGKGLGAANPYTRGNSYLNLISRDKVPVIIATTADDLAYMKSRGQQAGYMFSSEGTGSIILTKASRIQLIEEAIHYKQTKAYGVEYARRNINAFEFDAQMELLRIGKQEGWSRSSMQEIRKAAQIWGKRAIADIDKQLSELNR